MRAGVVIGSYGMPGAVELNIAAIRATCGPCVPILVYDDHTPLEEGGDRIRTIPYRYSGVELLVSDQNHGHANGDVQAFRAGLEWANAYCLSILVKFSQRFIITDHDWLEQDATAMISGGHDIYTQKAYHLQLKFRMRTECVMMNVSRCWPMAHAMSDRIGCSAEDAVANWSEQYGLRVGRWARIPPDRFEKVPGLLWHNSDSNDDYNDQATGYRELAARLGVDLGQEFSGAGWHVIAWKRPGTHYRML